MEGVKSVKYGPKFRQFNKWFKVNKHLLFCEVGLQEGILRQAEVVHHIVRAGKPFSDEPHFWMILCKTCHWYTTRCLQQFEVDRLIEWEEVWLKREYNGEPTHIYRTQKRYFVQADLEQILFDLIIDKKGYKKRKREEFDKIFEGLKELKDL